MLVGGRSVRFGRDKLLAEVGGRPMVAAPIAALRAVFGPRVTVVGDCDPAVRALADAWLPDDHPGTGPMGGIVTALARLGMPALVLAGDLPAIDAVTVRRLVDAFATRPDAAVVMATTVEDSRGHPCTAIYAWGLREEFQRRLAAGRFGLQEMLRSLPAGAVIRIACPAATLSNINEPSELRRHLASEGP